MVRSQVPHMIPASRFRKPSVARGAVVRARLQRRITVFGMDLEQEGYFLDILLVLLYQSARPAVMKHYKLGGLDNTLLFTVLGAGGRR